MSKAKTERELYEELRTETDHHANLVQKAIRRAVEAVEGAWTARNNASA
jgi:hypothetical protein